MKRLFILLTVLIILFAPNTGKTTQAQDTYKPVVIAMKENDLYAIQIGDLSSKKLTQGGGIYTSNQWPFLFSPDRTKLITKQNETWILVTKDNAQPLFQSNFSGNYITIAWSTDSKSLLIWHDTKQGQSMWVPEESEMVAYDLATRQVSTVKKFTNEFVGVVWWDKTFNVIAYTTGAGDGGAFGTYHVLNLTAGAEQIFNTRWLIPQITPNNREFAVFIEYDAQGNSRSVVNFYPLLEPDKPARAFPSPIEYFRCASGTGLQQCLGDEYNFWFVNSTFQLQAFDIQTGAITTLAQLPPQANLLSATLDRKLVIIDNNREYSLLDLQSGASTPLGLIKSGTTQPQGTSGNNFWNMEALGFLY